MGTVEPKEFSISVNFRRVVDRVGPDSKFGTIGVFLKIGFLGLFTPLPIHVGWTGVDGFKQIGKGTTVSILGIKDAKIGQ